MLKIIKLEYDIIQIIFKCCESEMYLILLLPNYKRTYDQINMIKKKELFIVNWSYSYDQQRVFATYQRMRANRTSWAGTLHQLSPSPRLPRTSWHNGRSPQE